MTMIANSVNYPLTYCREEDQNSYNCGLTTVLSASKRSRFLARKIHKIKKILKLRSVPKPSKFAASKGELSLEEKQNAENERLYFEEWRPDSRRGSYQQYAADEENLINENWENWDACQLCAGGKNNAYLSPPLSDSTQTHHSVCYVFMPDQYEPVAVKLRTARIPGGVLCVSYRPDVDIRDSGYVYSYTSYQQPQAQQALRPIMV